MVTYEEGMRINYRISCRCGYAGEWRKTRQEAFGDRLKHRSKVLPLRPPAAESESDGQ